MIGLNGDWRSDDSRNIIGDFPQLMPIFLAWKNDPAAMNIAENVSLLSAESRAYSFDALEVRRLEFENGTALLVFLSNSPLHSGHLIEGLRPKVAIVLSMHRSEASVPSLTVHPTGNIGKADYGGEPDSVSVAPAMRMKYALLTLLRGGRSIEDEFRISYETTHHGPTVKSPLMFLEIGSSLDQWTNKRAGELVARAAIQAAFPGPGTSRIMVGLGGPHYAPFFTESSSHRNVAIGHMVSYHQLPSLNVDLLNLLIARTEEKADGVLLDWKGLRTEKANVLSLLQTIGLAFEK